MTARRFLLLGAGDLAREVAKILAGLVEASGASCEIAAFSNLPGGVAPEFVRSCVTPAEALRDFSPSEWQAIGCAGSPRVREAMYVQFRGLGYRFATACDPAATLFAGEIGPGCVVFPGARLAIGC